MNWRCVAASCVSSDGLADGEAISSQTECTLARIYAERYAQTDSKDHIARGCEARRPSCTSHSDAEACEPHPCHTFGAMTPLLRYVFFDMC